MPTSKHRKKHKEKSRKRTQSTQTAVDRELIKVVNEIKKQVALKKQTDSEAENAPDKV